MSTVRPEAREDDGYTLTEMLVVIAIIALIAAVLTPGLINQLGRARAKAAQLQLESIAGNVEAFRSDVGRYPTDEEGIGALMKEPAGVDGWAGPYLKDSKSLSDPWGDPVIYRLLDPRRFEVESLGADGKPGGTGINKDLKAPVAPT